MAKLYTQLGRPIKSYSADELKNLIGHLKGSELMRTIILNEKEFLSVDYDRSLRGFWYSLAKPALDKLGKLSAADSTEEMLTKWDAELSRYVAELVRLGKVTYSDLRIVDTSRQRETPGETYSIVESHTFGYKINSADHPNIILCCEKDTVFSVLADMASLLGCSCISGKGQNSLAAMEDLLRRVGRADRIIGLVLSDYDPAGYSIAETFENQINDLKGGLGLSCAVTVERIGITPDQLTAEEVAANQYTPKPAGLAKWVQRTGGIGGQGKGLELDALTPDRIRTLFATGCKKYIDADSYRTFIKESFLRRMILEGVAPKFERLIHEIVTEELDAVELLDFDIFELAEQGLDSLPVDRLCYSDRQDAIQEKARSRIA